MTKTIYFYYKRDSLPQSEYKIIQHLNKFLDDTEKESYKISTSTASIFNIVRAFCHLNSLSLVAYYEDLALIMTKDMRMSQWSSCPDFDIQKNVLDILLTPKDDFGNYDIKL